MGKLSTLQCLNMYISIKESGYELMIGPNRFLFAEQGQSSAAAGVYVMYVNVHRCLLTPARVRHGTRGPAVA